MGQLILDISMSLDGFVTGPGADPDHGLGLGGERLHDWAITARTDADTQILERGFTATGAVLMGRRTFDVVDGPYGWADDLGYGAVQDQSAAPPNVVLTHSAPNNPRHTTGFTFVSGLREALDEAQRQAAGKDVVIMGGASLGGQYLDAGLVQEVRIHLAPVVLGQGTALFTSGHRTDLEQYEVISTPAATHLFYRVRPSEGS